MICKLEYGIGGLIGEQSSEIEAATKICQIASIKSSIVTLDMQTPQHS